MIQFIIITSILIFNTSAKLYLRNAHKHNSNSFGPDSTSDRSHVEYIIGDPLWVLQLSNDYWLDCKLRLGTLKEQEDFYYAVGPLVAKAHSDPGNNIKENSRTKNETQGAEPPRSNAELIRDIMQLLNKFMLSSGIQPDSYLSEDVVESHGPAIAIYFKGAASSLILRSGRKQWHYIIKESAFPSWFHERHDTFEAPLSIPEDIRHEFYTALLRLMRLLLHHPRISFLYQ